MNAIEIKNLNKKYKSGFELKDINLNVEEGTILGFIGENGAGKTTLIKSLVGILNIDSGSVRIFGEDFKGNGQEIREDLGLVLDEMFFPKKFTARDINSIMKDTYKNWDEDLFFSYIKRFNLPDRGYIKDLSKGMKKKLEIATALSHHPRLLILDEPTSGLDPVVREEILDIFLDFIQEESHTIFLSSHITSDLDKIADQIVFIDHGRILLDAQKDEILYSYGVLKCGLDEIGKIDPKDIISKRKNKFGYEILVGDKAGVKEKYPDLIVDGINLEDLMVLMVKGEK